MDDLHLLKTSVCDIKRGPALWLYKVLYPHCKTIHISVFRGLNQESSGNAEHVTPNSCDKACEKAFRSVEGACGSGADCAEVRITLHMDAGQAAQLGHH